MSEIRRRTTHDDPATDLPTSEDTLSDTTDQSTAVEAKKKKKTSVYFSKSVVSLIVVAFLLVLLAVGLLCWHLLDQESRSRPPHVLMLIADDLGWADVGWHSSDISTPTLTALAKGGVILKQFYSQPICTASRAALLTGRYPYKLGLQGSRPLLAGRIGSLPLSDELFPELLQKRGYRTHLIGKWHLGFESTAHTPIMRGFDSFTGFYNGMQDYKTHTTSGLDTVDGVPGYDMRRDFWDAQGRSSMDNILWGQNGTHNNVVFNEEAIEVINAHKTHHSDQPLFLCMSYPNPHSPIQAPDEFRNKNPQLLNQARRDYANLVFALDDSVAQITAALRENDMFDDTLVIFFSDNGGGLMTQNDTPTGSSNYPLKGDKAGLWEGGNRVPAFLSGKGIPSGKVSNSVAHVTDFYPTLINVLGLTASQKRLDGTDLTKSFQMDSSAEDKKWIVYDIDPVYKQAAIRYENWKLIIGNPAIHEANGRYPPLEEPDSTYTDPGLTMDAYVAAALKLHAEYREEGKMCRTVECFLAGATPKQVLLFDLSVDEFEFHNVAEENPDIVILLSSILDNEMKEMVEPVNLIQMTGEPAANPNNFNGAWMPWL